MKMVKLVIKKRNSISISETNSVFPKLAIIGINFIYYAKGFFFHRYIFLFLLFPIHIKKLLNEEKKGGILVKGDKRLIPIYFAKVKW